MSTLLLPTLILLLALVLTAVGFTVDALSWLLVIALLLIGVTMGLLVRRG